jgi:hypothetical protein
VGRCAGTAGISPVVGVAAAADLPCTEQLSQHSLRHTVATAPRSTPTRRCATCRTARARRFGLAGSRTSLATCQTGAVEFVARQVPGCPRYGRLHDGSVTLAEVATPEPGLSMSRTVAVIR